MLAIKRTTLSPMGRHWYPLSNSSRRIQSSTEFTKISSNTSRKYRGIVTNNSNT